MKKKIILIVCFLVLVGGVVFTSVGWNRSHKQNRQFFALIEQQTEIIDSLVNLPRNAINLQVSMDLTDKSKYTINGKGNSGTINAPNDKEYKLTVEIDSVSFLIKK